MSNPSLIPLSQPTLSTPYDEEIEAAFLGAILRDNRLYDLVANTTQEAHFYHPLHRRIFIAIRDALEKSQVADPVTLRRFFKNYEDDSAQSNEAEYLADLATNPIAVANPRHYAQILEDFYIKRELSRIGEETTAQSRNIKNDVSGQEQVELCEQKLFSLVQENGSVEKTHSIADSSALALHNIEQASKRKGRIAGVTTGLHDIDQILGGMHPSDLLILAGRPSMGKTALALNIAYNAATAFRSYEGDDGKDYHEGGKTLVFSLEMSSEQLAGRVMSSQVGISSDRLRRGEVNTNEFTRLTQASKNLANLPLYIDDTPALDVHNLRQRARRHMRQFGLNLIIIDYIQLVHASYGRQGAENRVQEMALITRHLKALAKELNVPVLALSQLSRAVEARDPPVPQLSDLRDSGTIEQDSDIVAFIYREEYYLERKSPERRANESDEQFLERQSNHQKRLDEARNRARLMIAKNRHGPVGTIDLHFNPDHTQFSNLDRHHGR